MRMWNVPPECLCRKHLMGEHQEMHMFDGSINKNINMKGFIENGLLETDKIIKRHEELKEEIIKRGYNHKSPIKEITVLIEKQGFVNTQKSLAELYKRCPECRKRIYQYYFLKGGSNG